MIVKDEGISVLMSVFRLENPNFLSRALRSVWFDQIVKPDEIVLVQDGPLTNDLLAVIDEWRAILAERMIIIKNEVNLGLTKSLNKGLKAVSFPFIARMDSDDIAMPNRFQLQSEFLQTHPDIDVVGGAIQEFFEEKELGQIRYYPQTNLEILHSINNSYDFHEYHKYKLIINNVSYH